MASRIRGVLFDYGLVLSGPPRKPAWEQLKSLLSPSGKILAEDTLHAAYWRPRHDYDRGALNGTTYWAAVAAALGQSSALPQRLTALQEADVDMWTEPNHEMIAWAAALQARGLRTAILSNLGDDMERGVRERCAWLGGFDHLTFSHALGTAKPDPAIYRHAAKGMGLPAGEILFVDDREDNIAAAHAFGMQAVRYTDHDEFVAELKRLEQEDLPLPSLLNA